MFHFNVTSNKTPDAPSVRLINNQQHWIIYILTIQECLPTHGINRKFIGVN